MKILLVGFLNGKVIEYNEDANGNWKMEKDYGDLGIGSVISNDFLGHIAVFGGRLKKNKKMFNMRFIDMKNKVLIGLPFETAIGDINSFSLGVISENQIVLALSGINCNYSHKKTDLFDVTDLFKSLDVKYIA